MKFIIDRSSLGWWLAKKAPYDGAIMETCIRVDERTTDAPEKVPSHNGETEWWYEKGRNHRVEDGHIKRDFDAQAWFIEINSLEELLALIANEGDIVVGYSNMNSDIPYIEIYDDYRE